ncbi:MAG: hypothetical protein Q9M36_14405 [Sulfurovum sp.]|nr:hypothetical protein [Sulfurovum sp.]
MHTHTLFSKLLKEPLLHFLLIGIAIFILFAQRNDSQASTQKPEIMITKPILNKLTLTFKEENTRPPTDTEMRILVEKAIRDEVLYHEAMAMGLDKQDRVIKHRLVEKMSYLFEDISILDEPSDAQLQVYFAQHRQQFLPSVLYSDIKPQVKESWIAQAIAKENQAFYQSLQNHYSLVLDDEIRQVLQLGDTL